MGSYLKNPCKYKDILYFESDDDIWSHHINHDLSQRLTNSQGVSKAPKVSPDGKWLCYLSHDDASQDIYMIPAKGGEKTRMTFTGMITDFRWLDTDHVIFASSAKSSHTRRYTHLYKLNIHDQSYKIINVGPAKTIQYADNGASVLGINLRDPALWKRYKGGTAGTLWLDSTGKGNYKQILKNISGNLTNPRIKDNKLYFLSDHQGVGNIYRSNLNGQNITRITHQDTYYVRNFEFDQTSDELVYQCFASIYKMDINSKKEIQYDLDLPTVATQAQPRIINPEINLNNFSINNSADKVLITSRGQLFVMPPWSGSPVRIGDEDARYRVACFIDLDKNTIIASKQSSDKEEHFVKFEGEFFNESLLLEDSRIGKPMHIFPSNDGKTIAFNNNRAELWTLKLNNKKLEFVDRVNHSFINATWSKQGNYLVYPKLSVEDESQSQLWIFSTENQETSLLFPSFSLDYSPSFSSCGDYLYFIGLREYNPVINFSHYDMCIPNGSKVYVAALKDETPFPMDLFLDFEQDKEDEDEDEENKKKKKSKKKSRKSKNKEDNEVFNLNKIGQRIKALPVAGGIYHDLVAVDEHKVFYVKEPIYNFDPFAPDGGWEGTPVRTLYSYSFKDKKEEKFCDDFIHACYTSNKKKILLYCEEGLRLVGVDSKPNDEDDFDKKDGWIDLHRIQMTLDPKKEWQQMYQEAWLLQREHFWCESMSKIDWETVYMDYLPLLEKVQTRSEFSDLIWEMQGELGTSHCYEMGGDYQRRCFAGTLGHLGAEFKFDERDDSFEITKIYQGMSWLNEQSSPLSAPGVDLGIGDKIYALNGQSFTSSVCLEKSLVGKKSVKITLKVKRKAKKNTFEQVSVKTLSSESLLRYREWVEQNRKYVHEKSRGKTGYIHIPDMFVHGISEFYRYYLQENKFDSLVIDVRYNGGGNMSSHILKVLAQKVIGFCETRYFGTKAYPMNAVNGPIVCITNEHAGSDGDIFSHSFKLFKLGKLIGKRTWGGVVGIWPRLGLNDGTYTTQPEFSHWFSDVGWEVENYGTDPDIEVDNLPQDWARGKDPQLDRAIKEVLIDLRSTPPLSKKLVSDKKKRPNFSRPRLPAK